MLIIVILLYFGMFFNCSHARETTYKNKHFVFVIPSYNNEEWYEKNLNSIISQEYDNWHAIYIDDVSTDETKHCVESFITDHHMEHKITLMVNEVRQGALANMYKAVNMCQDTDIIVTLDGDDWLSGPHVLDVLNSVYQDDNIWMTFGSYQEYPSGKKGIFSRLIPENVIALNSYRKHQWSSSHIRTFYAWLFKCIKKEDFMFKGSWLQMSGDLAQMIPMLELSGGRFKYISDILYIYNLKTPINDQKVNRKLQAHMEKYIRSKDVYAPLMQAIVDL